MKSNPLHLHNLIILLTNFCLRFASRVEEGEVLAKKKKKMGKSERERNKRKKEEEENKSKAVTNGIKDSTKHTSANHNNES